MRKLRRWAVAGAAVVVLAALLQVTGVLPTLNPFGIDTVDRSQPAVLQSVRDLAQFHAAAGDYEVVIDIERDVKWVPAPIAGERTLFVAAGSVNAYVDFAGLATDALVVSADRKSVELRLPSARLDKPNLDNERSYVFSQQRGLLDRLGGSPNQQQYYLAAEQRIATAAQKSGLLQRASENTRVLLTGMLQALGFRVVVVE